MSIQTPIVPIPVSAIEIDKAIFLTQLAFDNNLVWLSNGYGRAYRRKKHNNGKNNFVPMIYKGTKDGVPSYYSPLPDKSQKAMSFFVVGKEFYDDYKQKRLNYISWPVGIIFWTNQIKINKDLLDTEVFTQNLIRDVREVISTKLRGTGFQIDIEEVVQEPEEVWVDFDLDRNSDYMLAPYAAFRFNGFITMLEDCEITLTDQCAALLGSLSQDDRNDCILPTYDFSDDEIFNSLTPDQKIDLLEQLGLETMEQTREEFTVTTATEDVFITTKGDLAYSHTSVFLNGDQLLSTDFTLNGIGGKDIALAEPATFDDELIVQNLI